MNPAPTASLLLQASTTLARTAPPLLRSALPVLPAAFRSLSTVWTRARTQLPHATPARYAVTSTPPAQQQTQAAQATTPQLPPPAPEMITITLNGKPTVIRKGRTILEACKDVGVYLPKLCYHPNLKNVGTCRLCLVEVDMGGWTKLMPGCANEAVAGMKINTATKELQDEVRANLLFLRERHPNACMTCMANNNCEFQDLLRRYQVEETELVKKEPRVREEFERTGFAHIKDQSSPAVDMDFSKCVLCLRCVRACRELQGMNILGPVERGGDEFVSTLFSQDLNKTPCISCGACASACPVAAITEKPAMYTVIDLLEKKRALKPLPPGLSDDKKKELIEKEGNYIVVSQVAPAVRVTVSEAFDMPPGAFTPKQLAHAFRLLNFDHVFDTNFSADLTIMEEGFEFIGRLKKGGPFPMLTSCCPGWINMVEKSYPQLIPNLSSAKSPQQMLGAMAKTYYAQRLGLDPLQIKVVSIMPCVAKKDEAAREEHYGNTCDAPDVDYVLTTRELATLIRLARPRIHFGALKEEEFDSLLGEGSGAAILFGVTGGVMEAALRTAYAVLTPPGSHDVPRIDFTEIRGLQGIREAKIDFHGTEIRVAIANGGINLRKLCDTIINTPEKAPYHFVEMMACKGGCIGGAGNPKEAFEEKILQQRSAAVYSLDEKAVVRRSHENAEIKEIYDTYLGQPNGELAHHLLHTHYTNRKPKDF